MRLYFLRHGETNWNKERRLQGRTGTDINENGIFLAEKTRDGLKDYPIDICFTSPLLRARHTAEIVLEGRNVPVMEEDRLMEISFGKMEGRSLLDPEFPMDWFRAFATAPFSYVPYEEGESISDVITRCGSFLDELFLEKAYRDKNILISSHGCAVRAMLNRFYEDPSNFWQKGVPMNCSVSIVEEKDGKMTLVEEDKIFYDPGIAISGNFKIVKGEPDIENK